MKLNTAQQFTLSICEGGNPFRSYKAPHAYRGTPARVKRLQAKAGRDMRLSGMTPKLFTGHRP